MQLQQALWGSFNRFAGIVLSLFLAALPASAQSSKPSAAQPNDNSVITINTNVVSLHVYVTDQRGQFVTGLEQSAFQVYEDGVAQQISFFAQPDTPLTVALVFDLSGSMNAEKLARAREALARFVQTSHASDEYSLIGFNDKAWLALDRVRDGELLLRQFSGFKPTGQTALYDAVAFGLDHLTQGRYKRRALLVISDGEDNQSRATFKQIRRLAQESDALIYAVGIKDFIALRGAGSSALTDLANLTGGKAFFPHNGEEMWEALERIALELRQQYSVGYTPSNFVADSKWRKLKVKVKPPAGTSRVVVRSRPGYYATSDARARRDAVGAEN
jgi:Ca-activated chloride channel family protein